MFCPRCGHTVGSPPDSLCDQCGFDLSPLIAIVEPAEQATTEEVPNQAEQVGAAVQTPAASVPTKGKIILIIEDDRLISEMYKQRLVAAGYTVDVAGDGTEGINKLQTGQYNLLFLDVMLPGQNGLNILKMMKSEHKLPDIPVFVLSNLDQGAVIDRSLDLGAVHYLVKANYTPGEILKLVDEVLS